MKKRELSFYNRVIKRAIDLFVALVGIIILCIPMLIISVFIKCDSKGPVLFRQKRIGKNGKVFEILKFRSMCVGAEKTGSGVYSGKGTSGRFLGQHSGRSEGGAEDGNGPDRPVSFGGRCLRAPAGNHEKGTSRYPCAERGAGADVSVSCDYQDGCGGFTGSGEGKNRELLYAGGVPALYRAWI